MKVKMITDEDFCNYQKPSMYIGTAFCNGKCCIESGIPMSVCQNDGWRKATPIEVDDDAIIKRYLNNPITQAICFSGLEPFEQFSEMHSFISKLRNKYRCDDDVVIFTGYYQNEILPQIIKLKNFRNIVIKFGRFIPDQEAHYDEVLGVKLASDNQYAIRIS